LLGLVDDADELLAGLGDDLLAGERAAAALDQAVPGIALVGAVDVQLQRPDRVEVEHRDAYLLELTGAALGTGDGALDPALDPAQALDEIGHGRAGADADDGAVLDEFQGFLGGQLLLFFTRHRGLRGAGHSRERMCRNCAFDPGSTDRRLPRRSRANSPRASAWAFSSSRVITRASLRTKRTSTSHQRGSSGLLPGSW